MPPVTYVTYTSGIDAKHLHLGNLVHDFKDPLNLEPYEEKAYTDVAEPAPEWARARVLQNFALTLEEAPDDEDEEDEEDKAEGKRYLVAAAAKAIQLEINDPEAFFNEITLKSDKSKQWLASHISAAEALQPHPRPEIWMATGLILMTHATWTSLSSKQIFTPGLPAPVDPTGVTAIRRSSVSDHIRPVLDMKKKRIQSTLQELLYMRLGNILLPEAGRYVGKRSISRSCLLRSGREISARIALLELKEGVYAQNEDRAVEGDDKYWDTFIDLVEEFG